MASSSSAQALIPNLPDDVALQCLLRVPRMYHVSMRSVSKAWNKLIQNHHFFAARIRSGFANAWLFLILEDLTQYTFCIYDLASKSMLCRSPLPPSSPGPDLDLDHALVSFKAAAVGTSLIILESKCSSFRTVVENQMRIFDTVSNRWMAASSPGIRRSQFAMAAVGSTVYLAGGHDSAGNFESATEAYDVAKNEWRRVSSMNADLDRVDAEVVYQGKIYVRGFMAESQDCIVLVYDPAADSWQEVRGINGLDHGDLVATSDGIYNLTSSDCFYKFDWAAGVWGLVGESNPGHKSPSSLVLNFNAHSQRVFGFGNEIFLLGGELGRSFCLNGSVTCHGLFLGNSWYKTGSIVIA